MPGLAEKLRDAPGEQSAAQAVDVVALSADVTLYQAIRSAAGERNTVWRARSAAEAVDLLMTGRCGVLLIDMGAIYAQPVSLVQQITDQFPDVVIVVAGRRDDEALLAQLITDGLVYRFMHKPLSPKRAGMFLNAAIRCHLERRGERPTPQLLAGVDAMRTRLDPYKWLFVGGGLLLFLVLLGAVLIARHESPRATTPVESRPASRASPRALAAPLADPVLSAARAAYAAGRYESPTGRNALDLYSSVLDDRPDSAEARQGLHDTTRRVVADAEAATAAGDRVEAMRLVKRVLGVDPQNFGARALQARLEPPVEIVVPLPPPLPEAPPPESPPVAAPITRSQVPQDPLTARGPGTHAVPGMSTARPVHTRSYRARGTSANPVARDAPRTVPALPIARTFEPAPAPAPPATAAVALPPHDLEAISTPDPHYPPQAFRGRIEGWVDIDYTVDETGATTDLVIVASEPQGVFDAAAMEAVASWRYLPRVVNGRPAPQRTSVTLRFNVVD